MFAVIKTGGKQYKVRKGDELKIEKLPGKEGKKVVFYQVLLLSKQKRIKVGTPIVKAAKVEVKILEQGREGKIRILKFKPKKRYKKTIGHREPYTKIKVTKI